VSRTQNDNYALERRGMCGIAALNNEIRSLTQRKTEVEYSLLTRQFREYEAMVFLRQFWRFYRRLLRNRAHQRTGRTSEVIERVSGVPDLKDLIHVDSLLLEARLIEDSGLHDWSIPPECASMELKYRRHQQGAGRGYHARQG